MTQLTPLLNHLWQSTLFAGGAALLTLALRKNRAHVRYWVWLVASIKFLIPFAALFAIGSQLEWRPARAFAPSVPIRIEHLSEPFIAAMPAIVSPNKTPVLPGIVFGVWLAGCAVVGMRWALRWRKIRRVLRSADPANLRFPIPVLSSSERIEPGIFGVFRPVLLLPAGIEERLTTEQLQTVLAHESCHVRRRDNVTAAIHMAVELLFWFHPLVWWIGGRLIDERERACDEEVLRQGGEAEVYATGIVNVCRLYIESPLPCASGVTGADLRNRVERIMTGRILDGLTPARKFLLAIAAAVAVCGPLVIGIMRGQDSGPLKFEVATIRPAGNSTGKGGIQLLPGGELRMEGTTVKSLIAFAYGVRPDQITGGPHWLDSEAYSLHAKPEHPTAEDFAKTAGPGTAGWQRMEERLRGLLANRCGLVIEKSTKETSGYALTVAKGGTKLKATSEEGPARTMRSRGKIDAARGTMQMLAAVLSNMLGRPVADRTGLTETYTYTLEYAQDFGPGGKFGVGDSAPLDASGPSVFTALQEQLGLKLESAKVPLESIVIQKVEKPSAN